MDLYLESHGVSFGDIASLMLTIPTTIPCPSLILCSDSAVNPFFYALFEKKLFHSLNRNI